MTDTEILEGLEALARAYFKVEIRMKWKASASREGYPNPFDAPKYFLAVASRETEQPVEADVENETLTQQYQRKRAEFFEEYDLEAARVEGRGDSYTEALSDLVHNAKEKGHI
ncbi:hypothetical protein [Nocardiopsis metallicus]|uniref:Uncharacterized protein n=1 Tax=Nocardiopsis metallicus TaxID=179819 RepID=A0A840WCS9_9ACTN|nr:hypothetical protein [Nocardiopsis metallicus]MBB5489056.1 hypothetical protein [Nocardiopsis metallicus]